MKTRLLGLLLKDFTTLIKGDNRKSCYRLFLFKPNKKVTVLGAVMGAVIGLVAITPGSGYVPFGAALVIGAWSVRSVYSL